MKIACVTPDGKFDYLCATVLEGLTDLGHELVVSDPGNGVVKHAMNDGDFKAIARDADLLLLFFGKVRGNRPPRHYFLDELGFPKERVGYVDGGEWRFDGWHTKEQEEASLLDPSRRRGEPWLDEGMFQRCGHYFKRECYKQDVERGVIPLPFAMRKKHVVDFPQGYIDVGEKDIDVFCSFGQARTGMRKEAIAACEHLRDTHNKEWPLNVVVRHDLSPEEYKDHLRRARVVVDAWGGGDCCDRFWEGVGAKACVLHQRYNIEFPDPFVDWDTAVGFSTVEELSNNLHRLAYNNSEAEAIGQRGFKHALERHTAEDRAQRIINALA